MVVVVVAVVVAITLVAVLEIFVLVETLVLILVTQVVDPIIVSLAWTDDLYSLFSCFPSSPLHHLLVSSSSPTVPLDMESIVGQRVLCLVVVVGSQQHPGPDAHVVRRQSPAELRWQTLRLDELVERVQVVAVEEDLRRDRMET